MAHTFQDLVDHFTKAAAFPSAFATLVITQQDGRTSYGTVVLHSYDSASETFSGGVTQIFNDRIHPHGPGTFDDQPFAINRVDISDIRLRRITPGTYKAEFVLRSWGNATTGAELQDAPPQTKILIGWGDTIGHGKGRALYALSLNTASDSVG